MESRPTGFFNPSAGDSNPTVTTVASDSGLRQSKWVKDLVKVVVEGRMAGRQSLCIIFFITSSQAKAPSRNNGTYISEKPTSHYTVLCLRA